MHRFFAVSCPEGDGLADLLPEESRHAVTVLRLKAGSRVEVVCDGCLWAAVIHSTDNSRVCVKMLDRLPSSEPELSVTLFQGIPKADKMDLIVQKATELGVSRIVPLEMERCVVRISSGDTARKLDRWRRIAREAGKQSGRTVIPEIAAPRSLASLRDTAELPEITLVPWEREDRYGLLAFRRDHPEIRSLGILIGPEGGISETEMDFLTGLGFIPVTLGKRILRTETAGLASLAALMCLYGEMEQA